MYEVDVKDFDGIYKTKSLGGININETSFNITIDAGVNITFSAHNLWNGTGTSFNLTETNVSGTFRSSGNYFNVQRNTSSKTFQIFNSSYMNSFTYNVGNGLSSELNLSFYQAIANVNVLTDVTQQLIVGSNITANSSTISNSTGATTGSRTFYVDSDVISFNASNPNTVYTTSSINYTTFSLGDNITIDLYLEFNGTLNFFIYDAETLDLISDEEINLDLFNEYQGFTKSMVTGNGTNTSDGIPEGELRITASGTNYNSGVKFFDIDSLNYSQNVNMYLVNQSNPSIGNLFVYVYNQDFYTIKNADTRLLQFDSGSGDFIEVAQCYSNSNGECVFDIILGTTRYVVTTQAVINNVTITARSSDNGDFFPIDNTEIELYLRYQGEYSVPDDYGLVVTPYNASLVGNTSYLWANFIDVYGNSHTICIGYYFKDGFDEILAYEDCTSGSSGTVGYSTSYVLNRTYNWRADIYSTVDGNRFKTYESFLYSKEDSFQQEFDIYLYPMLILLMSILLGMSIQLKNILIFPIGMIPTLILYGFILPTVFTPKIIGVIIVWCILVIYISRKRSDNEAT